MDRAELEALVGEGLTIRQIAARTGKGYSTIRYWLRRHGLATKRGATRVDPADGTIVCLRHGRVRWATDTRGTRRCARCRSEQVAARRRKVKRMLVEEAGGRCFICGYDRYVGALQFYHLEPSTKSFQLGMGGLTRSIEAMRAEAAKCVLLCSNCHAEVEGGVATLV